MIKKTGSRVNKTVKYTYDIIKNTKYPHILINMYLSKLHRLENNLF